MFPSSCSMNHGWWEGRPRSTSSSSSTQNSCELAGGCCSAKGRHTVSGRSPHSYQQIAQVHRPKALHQTDEHLSQHLSFTAVKSRHFFSILALISLYYTYTYTSSKCLTHWEKNSSFMYLANIVPMSLFPLFSFIEGREYYFLCMYIDIRVTITCMWVSQFQFYHYPLPSLPWRGTVQEPCPLHLSLWPALSPAQAEEMN